MLDAKLLRTDLEETAESLARRGFDLDTARLSELEARRKELQVETQDLQTQRNSRSKSIGQAKAAGSDIEPLRAEVTALGERLKATEVALRSIQGQLRAIALGIPNIPHPSVPEGRNEEDNVEIRRWGEPRVFDFEPREHM